ncbi:MAG: DUF4760 domain-containing protein [Pseudonocardiaceae bacterium]
MSLRYYLTLSQSPLETKQPFPKWANEDRVAMITLINTFAVAGLWIRSGLANEQVIIDSWGARIRSLAEMGAPLIAESRKHFGTDMYWHDFEWLAKRRGLQHVE